MIETRMSPAPDALIGQTIGTAPANANNRNGFARYRSEAAD
jgi:hypothetical protein